MTLEEALSIPADQVKAVVPRKLRVLGVGPKYSRPEQLTSAYAIHGHYLQRELVNRIDLELIDGPDDQDNFYRTADLSGYDFILGFGLRWFEKKVSIETCRALKSRFKGGVVQFADLPVHESEATLTLAVKDVPPRSKPFRPYRVIGWAADPELCKPEQPTDILTILCDHYDYNARRKDDDLTREILEQVQAYYDSGKWKSRFADFKWSSLTTPKLGFPAIPFPGICKRYNEAHIFIVTHAEAVGLSVIEAATAGCLVMAPREAIDENLLATVRHLEFKKLKQDPRKRRQTLDMRWEEALGQIDPAACRQKALEQTWGKVADRVVKALQDFRR